MIQTYAVRQAPADTSSHQTIRQLIRWLQGHFDVIKDTLKNVTLLPFSHGVTDCYSDMVKILKEMSLSVKLLQMEPSSIFHLNQFITRVRVLLSNISSKVPPTPSRSLCCCYDVINESQDPQDICMLIL